jgi:glycine betaine/proline transport system ATP-binding protein
MGAFTDGRFFLESIIEAEHVSKVFGPPKNVSRALSMLSEGTARNIIRERTGCLIAVNDVSLDVRPGELFVLMGLSGSGKSTFLRCLNGIIPATAGTITISGTRLDATDDRALKQIRRQHLTMVFQHFGLLPHRSVRSNVGFGLEIRGKLGPEERKEISNALEQVGLGEWADSLPRELSGGMQQRVGLARALATGAPILLMDEPFSALDPLIRREMQDELIRLQRELGRTIVFVTHDLNEAMKLGDRIGIMREGMLVQVGTSEEILSQPADDYVAQFVEDIDRGRALTASSIMRTSEPVLATAGPRQALREMRQRGLSSVFVTERDDLLVGILRVDQAVAAIEKHHESIREITDHEVLKVAPEDPVVDVARGVATERVPAAVVDEQGRLLGIVTWVDIVSTVGGISVQDAQSPNPPSSGGGA